MTDGTFHKLRAEDIACACRHDKLCHSRVSVRLVAHVFAEVRLRIEVDEKYAHIVLLDECSAEVVCGGGLADSAFLIADCDIDAHFHYPPCDFGLEQRIVLCACVGVHVAVIGRCRITVLLSLAA